MIVVENSFYAGMRDDEAHLPPESKPFEFEFVPLCRYLIHVIRMFLNEIVDIVKSFTCSYLDQDTAK